MPNDNYIQDILDSIKGGEVLDPLVQSIKGENQRFQGDILPLLQGIQQAGQPTTTDKITKALTAVAAIADLTSGNQARRQATPAKFQAVRGQNEERISSRSDKVRQKLRDKLAVEEIFGKKQATITELKSLQARLDAQAGQAKAGVQSAVKQAEIKANAAENKAKIDDLEAKRKLTVSSRDSLNTEILKREGKIEDLVAKSISDEDVIAKAQADGTTEAQARIALINALVDQQKANDLTLSQLVELRDLRELELESIDTGKPLEQIIAERAAAEADRVEKIKKEQAKKDKTLTTDPYGFGASKAEQASRVSELIKNIQLGSGSTAFNQGRLPIR